MLLWRGVYAAAVTLSAMHVNLVSGGGLLKAAAARTPGAIAVNRPATTANINVRRRQLNCNVTPPASTKDLCCEWYQPHPASRWSAVSSDREQPPRGCCRLTAVSSSRTDMGFSRNLVEISLVYISGSHICRAGAQNKAGFVYFGTLGALPV